MTNPPRKKGTAGETEVVKLFNEEGIMGLLRTSPGVNYDIAKVGEDPPLQLLATRPDGGRWLVTLDARELARLLAYSYPGQRRRGIQIEVKRYRRFSLHAIYEAKFNGRAKQ